MFGAIAGGIASALAGGAMSKLFGGGQKAASGGIQGDVLATDNNTVGMGDAGIKSAIQGSNVPNPDEAVPSFVSGHSFPTRRSSDHLRKTLLMASSVRLKPLNCSRLPCVYAQETLTFLLTQKKTCVKNYVQKE